MGSDTRSPDAVEADTLPRAEYARLLGVQDLAAMLVAGWDSGYPLSDGTESERDLVDRLRAALNPTDTPA